MDFNELLEACQAEAIFTKVNPTDESVWRALCRQYSRMFHTPLAQVMDMEPRHVILNVYEEQFADLDVEENMEQILDMIYTLQDPEYAKEKRDDLKDFIKRALAEEEERLAKGKPIHKAMSQEVSLPKNTSEQAPETPKNLPQSGGINLSYLDAEESEGGFDEF